MSCSSQCQPGLLGSGCGYGTDRFFPGDVSLLSVFFAFFAVFAVSVLLQSSGAGRKRRRKGIACRSDLECSGIADSDRGVSDGAFAGTSLSDSHTDGSGKAAGGIF